MQANENKLPVTGKLWNATIFDARDILSSIYISADSFEEVDSLAQKIQKKLKYPSFYTIRSSEVFLHPWPKPYKVKVTESDKNTLIVERELRERRRKLAALNPDLDYIIPWVFTKIILGGGAGSDLDEGLVEEYITCKDEWFCF